jgi:hypothetical protein
MLAAMLGKKRDSAPLTGYCVIVHTKDQRSIVGYVIGRYEDGSVVLRNARTLPGKEKIVGDAVFIESNISWIQRDVPPHLLTDGEQ